MTSTSLSSGAKLNKTKLNCCLGDVLCALSSPQIPIPNSVYWPLQHEETLPRSLATPPHQAPLVPHHPPPPSISSPQAIRAPSLKASDCASTRPGKDDSP